MNSCCGSANRCRAGLRGVDASWRYSECLEEFTTLGTDSDGYTTRNTRRYGFMAIQRVHEVEELLRKVLLSGEKKGQA